MDLNTTSVVSTKRTSAARLVTAPLMLLSVLLSTVSFSALTPLAAQAHDGPEKVCESHSLQVHLIPGDPTMYNLVGKLCWRGEEAGNAVQLLVHGATYAGSYWDFPNVGEKYSYVNAAVDKGYATFAYDRLGSGASDKPLGILVNVDNSAYVNHQVVEALRSGAMGSSFEKVVLVGHSFGSLIAVAAASTYHDVDAVVLTGFAHQATAAANAATQASVYPAAFDPKFAAAGLDQFYFTTIPGTRAGLFFNTAKTTSAVLAADESEKDLMTLGLVLDIPRHFSTESLGINVPVYMIMGSKDAVYCGEQVDCSNPQTYQTYESGFFANVDTKIVKGLGHSLNLHKGSKKVFESINTWIGHTVGHHHAS